MATDPGQESPVRALLRMTPPRDEGARFLFLGLPLLICPLLTSPLRQRYHGSFSSGGTIF